MAPSFLVDEFWHEFILNTKLYFKCAKICGKYIHHVPNDGSKSARSKDMGSFWSGLTFYIHTFGEPDFKVWGIQEKGIRG